LDAWEGDGGVLGCGAHWPRNHDLLVLVLGHHTNAIGDVERKAL
jgi:hypothetical protein